MIIKTFSKDSFKFDDLLETLSKYPNKYQYVFSSAGIFYIKENNSNNFSSAKMYMFDENLLKFNYYSKSNLDFNKTDINSLITNILYSINFKIRLTDNQTIKNYLKSKYDYIFNKSIEYRI